MFVLLILIASVLIGLMLRRWRLVRFLDHSTTWTVWLLIFVFGISLGSNRAIIDDFAHFGLVAFLVAIAGIVGSVLSAWAYGRFIDKRKKA